MRAAAFDSLEPEPRWVAWRNETRDGQIDQGAVLPA